MGQENGGPVVEIRRLQGQAEADKWARFMAESEPWKTLRRSYEEGLAMFDDPARETYLALVKGQSVGLIILRLDGAFRGYIQTVGVLPDWRGRGVGVRLIEFAEERIFAESPNAFVCVSSFNPRARQLYERLGFEVVGDLKDYIIPGHAEVLLRKTIAPLTEFRPPAKG